jgi:hypothetical protein
MLHDVIASTDCTENTTSLLLFTGHCLATAGCYGSTVIALSKSVTVLILLFA